MLKLCIGSFIMFIIYLLQLILFVFYFKIFYKIHCVIDCTIRTISFLKIDWKSIYIKYFHKILSILKPTQKEKIKSVKSKAFAQRQKQSDYGTAPP